MAKITAMEQKRKRKGWSIRNFYAAPRRPASKSALPIFDRSHTRNAMARFNQTRFRSRWEKIRAYLRIRKATRKFKIDISEFNKRRPKK